MRKNKYKLAACIMAVALSMGFAGCGKEQVDYDIGNAISEGEAETGDDENAAPDGEAEIKDNALDSIGEQDVSGLRRDLAIPESEDCELEIDTSVSNVKSVKISDDDITVPNRDKMYTIVYDKQDMDDDYKKQVIESFFDDDRNVRTIDINLSSSEIDENSGELLGGDCESNAYTGWRGDFFYELIFWEDDLGEKSYQMTCLNIGDIYAEKYEKTVHEVYTEPGDEDMENLCAMTEEEAVATAEEFILSTDTSYNFGDLYLINSLPLCWFADGANAGADGYSLVFGIAVDGQEIYTPSLFGLDYMNEGTYAQSVSFEITVELDDDGIIGYSSTYPMVKTGEKEATDLITFDEAVEILADEVPKFYVKNATGYEEITFNDVRLTYYIINDNDENTFEIIPAYTFAQFDLPGSNISDEEYDLEYERLESRPIHLFIVNANDGTVIDPVDASYGTYTK